MKPLLQGSDLGATSASAIESGAGMVGRNELDVLHLLIQNAALFVQNLCENHNLEMKNFLRLQDQAIANVDLVAGIANVTMKMCEQLTNNITYLDDETSSAFLDALGRTYVSDSAKQPKLVDWFKTSGLPEKKAWMTFIQLVRTLTELVQGPVPINQEALTQARVSTALMQVLELFSCIFYKGRFRKMKRDFTGDSKRELLELVERLSTHQEVRIEVAHINRKALNRSRGRTQLPNMRSPNEKKK